MKAITKVIIFIAGIALVACITSAFIYVHKIGLAHTELFQSNSSKHDSTDQTGNDTNSRMEAIEPTTISQLQPDQDAVPHSRAKRAIIFRPLFVYRQQQIKKQRLSEERERQLVQQMSTTTQRPRTQRPKYASNYPYTG